MRSVSFNPHIFVAGINWLLLKVSAVFQQKQHIDLDEDENKYVQYLIKTAGWIAKGESDERTLRWMAATLATLPQPSDSTGLTLVTDILQTLTSAQGQVMSAQQLEDDLFTQELTTRAKRISDELANKLNATQDTLNNKMLPSIAKLGEALKNQTDAAINNADDAGSMISANSEEIKRLKKRQATFKGLSIFGGILSFIGTQVAKIPEVGAVAALPLYAASKVTSYFSDKELGKIGEQINELNAKIAKDAELKANLEHILPLLDASSGLVKGLKSSNGTLDVLEWLTSGEMLNFKAHMILLPTESVEATLSGQSLWQLLTEAANNLVAIMNQAQYYKDQRSIVGLLAPSPTAGKLPKLPRELQSLRAIITENALVSTYRSLVGSLQLFSFPYCSLIRSSSTENCMSNRTLDRLVSCGTEYYNTLVQNLMTNRGGISGNDKRSCSLFDIEPYVDGSFMTWSNEKYKDQIAQLLSGEEVLLYSDVLQSLDNTYAVKFNELSLKFWRGNVTEHTELKEALQKFNLYMRHMGTSYFKCGEDVVSFSHRLVDMHFSFAWDEMNKTPEEYSDDYLRLRGGDPIISPYATWAIKLKPRSRFRDTDFSSLKPFASEVSMSLVGHGSYVEGAQNCGDCKWDLKLHNGGTNGRLVLEAT